MAAGTQSITGVIKHDHEELKDYYNRIVKSNSDDEKMRFANQFTWELARHSVGEEIVVYPAMEKYVENGKVLADRDRKEHQTAKELLYEFQGLNPSDSNFTTTLEHLFGGLEKHMKEEEEEDLPALEKGLGDERSEELARSFGRTKMFVPTRSHPSAPDKPPFETVVGLLTAPLDKIKDAFSKFPKE